MSVNAFYSDFDTAAPAAARSSSSEHRTRFQIDRDRIIHSAALRRLQGKTQVLHSFMDAEYDFFRTRLTHSLEVAQIGRSICEWLKKNSGLLGEDESVDGDLVEAACLAHDLGHPPFGHTGEQALHRLMEPYGGFEGNAQTLRLLTRLMFAENSKGMNPTRALLDAILKYKTLHRDAGGAARHYLYDEQEEYVSFAMDDAAFPADLTPGEARNHFRSLECQIMDWADDTAYSINDLCDAIQAGLITISKLENWAAQHSLSNDETEQVQFIISAMRDGKVEARLGRGIGDHIRACELRGRQNILSAKSRRYQLELVVEEAVMKRAQLNKRLSRELVFNTPELQQLDYKASLVLEKLFEVLRERYVERSSRNQLHLLPPSFENAIEREDDKNRRARLVCDWLANLTDRGAFRMHQRLFDLSFLSE